MKDWILLAVIAALLIALGTTANCLNTELHKEQSLRKATEAELLEANNVVTAKTAEADVLANEASQVPLLKQELARVNKIVKTQEVAIAKLSTGPVDIPVSTTPSQASSESTCVLRQPDKVVIKTVQLELETNLDNHVLIGVAECWRDQPPALLGSGKLTGTFKRKIEPVEDHYPWWVHELIGSGATLIAIGIISVAK